VTGESPAVTGGPTTRVAILLTTWLALAPTSGLAWAEPEGDRPPVPTGLSESVLPARVPAAPGAAPQTTPTTASGQTGGQPAADIVSPPPLVEDATPMRPVRSELSVSIALNTGLLVLPKLAPLPLPEVGFVVGLNLGSRVLVDVGVGFAYFAGGAKLFLGTADITPYLLGRVGATPWTGEFVLGGAGLDVSRADGTYAYVEGGPLLARSEEPDVSPPPAHWRTIDIAATFGYGKRY
jgi:hypothetical protein